MYGPAQAHGQCKLPLRIRLCRSASGAPLGGSAEGATGEGDQASSSHVQPSLATMALDAGGPQLPAA